MRHNGQASQNDVTKIGSSTERSLLNLVGMMFSVLVMDMLVAFPKLKDVQDKYTITLPSLLKAAMLIKGF